MTASADINELEILDEQIGSLRLMLKDNIDLEDKLKINAHLLKALAMRRKILPGRKGKGFNLK